MINFISSLQRYSASGASSATNFATQLISNLTTTISNRHCDFNAIVRRLIKHNNHQFRATLLKEPTRCAFCHKMIWLPHGQRCELCGLVSHMNCVCLVEVYCSGGVRQEVKTIKVHAISKETCLSPTACNHCGTYVVFLKTFYKCSKCVKNFHEDCMELAANDCRRRTHDRIAAQYNNTSRMTIDQFDLCGRLGTGSFSTVYLARRKTEQNRQYAIKVIKKTNPVVNGDPNAVFNEWQCLQLGRSYPFLTIAHCCFQSRERLYFVMEYVPGRDLLYYIRKEGAFTENRVKFYAAEIILALIYMHKNDITYRDLKLNNVILDPFGHCKLIDFGMSKKLLAQNEKKTNTFCGTVYYISPEILRGDSYDCSVDWWSLGVLMYEMLCDKLPFDGDTDDEIFNAIKFEDITYPGDVHLSEKARSILDGLLTKDSKRRLGCVFMEDYELAIKYHPFFSPSTNGDNTLIETWWQDVEAKRLRPPYVPSKRVNDLGLDSEHIDMSPVDTKHIDEIPQSCFDNFSQYSESFTD